MNQLEIDATSMDHVIQCMHRWAGVTLDHSKTYLVQQRLSPLRHEFDCSDVSELIKRAEMYGNQALQSKIVDALTTHETKFFRDDSFIHLMSKHILPALIAKATAGKQVQIWSAGCSTGQEACSVAMMIAEATTLDVMRRFKILGTDVSPRAVEQASSLTYTQHELQRGLSEQRIATHFEHHDDQYRLAPSLRAMLRFRVESLAKSVANNGSFDLILCRNVLIYFNEEDTRRIAKQLSLHMDNESYLVVGSSEMLTVPTLTREMLGGSFVYRTTAAIAS